MTKKNNEQNKREQPKYIPSVHALCVLLGNVNAGPNTVN